MLRFITTIIASEGTDFKELISKDLYFQISFKFNQLLFLTHLFNKLNFVICVFPGVGTAGLP